MEFSVLMSVYKNDKKEFLKLAIDSVINQTIKPNEIVLVEDGPVPDEIEQLIKEYEKNYNIFKIVRNKENAGLGNALKIGLQECRYNLVARMDSDDISVPDRFEKQLKEFEKDKELSIVGGFIEEFIDDTSNIVGIRDVPLEDKDIKQYIKSRCPLNHMTVMFKKEEVLKVGNYIEWHYNEDYYLWLRMYLANCKFKNLSYTLVKVRVGNEMYKRRGGLEYFKSEASLQKFMLKNKIISFPKFIYNVLLRLILQVLMPNKLRALIFKKFARKESKNGSN